MVQWKKAARGNAAQTLKRRVPSATAAGGQRPSRRSLSGAPFGVTTCNLSVSDGFFFLERCKGPISAAMHMVMCIYIHRCIYICINTYVRALYTVCMYVNVSHICHKECNVCNIYIYIYIYISLFIFIFHLIIMVINKYRHK